jgi:hypothetical protein
LVGWLAGWLVDLLAGWLVLGFSIHLSVVSFLGADLKKNK